MGLNDNFSKNNIKELNNEEKKHIFILWLILE
jgi:hypothetical protein